MTILDDVTALGAAMVAEYEAGGYEPDGVGLEKGNPTPNDPRSLGWGSTVWCMDDVDENWTEVDPNSTAAVEADIYRFLTTPTGGILTDPEILQSVGEDPNYGYPLVNILSQDLSALQVAAHTDLARVALVKSDDRLSTCSITLTQRADSTFDLLVYGELKTGESYRSIIPLSSETRGEFP
jgi:hypothetical protein